MVVHEYRLLRTHRLFQIHSPHNNTANQLQIYIPQSVADQIWLLGREREDFQVEMRTRIHDTLRRLGLDPERLVLSKNKDCAGDAKAGVGV